MEGNICHEAKEQALLACTLRLQLVLRLPSANDYMENMLAPRIELNDSIDRQVNRSRWHR